MTAQTPERLLAKNRLAHWRTVAAFCLLSVGSTLIGCQNATPAPTETLLPIASSTSTPETTATMLPTITPTPSSSPTPTTSPTPEKLIEENDTFVSTSLASFFDEAKKYREVTAQNDSEYLERAPQTVNKNRLNFVLLVEGDTNEPPLITKPGVKIGGISIYSYNSAKNNYDSISISHDFNSPEAAQKIYGNLNIVNPSTRISMAFRAGGWETFRKEIERATSLSADLPIILSDEEIGYFIDLLGGIDVKIPEDLPLFGCFYADKSLDPVSFKAGSQAHLDGANAVCFIKRVPVEDNRGYKNNFEHHRREQLVVDAITEKLAWNLITNSEFRDKFFYYLNHLGDGGGKVLYGFDPAAIKKSGERSKKMVGNYLLQPWKLGIPTLGTKIYLADDRSGSKIPPGPSCNGVRYNKDMFVPKGVAMENPIKSSWDYWKFQNTCMQGLLK